MNKLKDWQVMMMSAGMIFVLIGVGCYFFHQWAAYVVYGVKKMNLSRILTFNYPIV